MSHRESQSSLLASILRETHRVEGRVRVDGRIAYCSQVSTVNTFVAGPPTSTGTLDLHGHRTR